MKESKFVKTKIVAGYLLLIAVCILSVGYVYRVAVRFSAPDRSYALLHTKRSAVNRTLYHLYQAESYGQLMIAGYASYEARYRRELRTVRASIDQTGTERHSPHTCFRACRRKPFQCSDRQCHTCGSRNAPECHEKG